MTQGIWVQHDDGSFYRPVSKKEVKNTLPERIRLERTSFMGNEFDGIVSQAPMGVYYFVGPDPERKRSFYGQIVIASNGQIYVR